MKTWPLLLLPVLALASSCSQRPPVCVSQTHVATIDVTAPRAIYIRPMRLGSFDACSPSGDRALRASLAPIEFANDLQEELAKIAPARVLKCDEAAPCGWLVDGEFESIESGYPPVRWWPCNSPSPWGQPSRVKMHIRITDARCGTLIYAFDVVAHTDGSLLGSATRPGMGYPLPFDFRNAAEQVYVSLTPDPFRYGARVSPAIRY